MHGTRRIRLVALVACLALTAAACGSRSSSSSKSSSSGSSSGSASGGIDTSSCPPGGDSTGVSGNTITFGSSYPQSGLYAPFASILKGAQAFFDYTNANGGVEVAGKKYQLKLDGKDDAYEPAKTAANTQSLVNDDKVFGMFSVVGTANNIAIRDFLGRNCVPDLFAGSGSPAWGNPKYPWLIGSTLAPYSLEVNAFVSYLQKNKPNATVAILYATDDFGQAYEKSFKEQIKGTNIKVVAEETYNPEDNKVDSQMTTLAASKADAFLMGATLLACPAALKAAKNDGWSPITWGSGTCAAKTLIGLAGDSANNLLSETNIKDPQNPSFDNDPAMQLYKQQVKKLDPKVDTSDGIVAYGWTQGALLVETLKRASAPTRSAVMNSALNLKGVTGVGLLLNDASLTSSYPSDKFLGEIFQVEQYDAAKGYFNDVGPITNLEGKTVSLTPSDVLNG